MLNRQQRNAVTRNARELARHTLNPVPAVIRALKRSNTLALQVRCGCGSFTGMKTLLQAIHSHGKPHVGSVTIDSYTRNGQFKILNRLLSCRKDTEMLNGYPLVNYGKHRCFELLNIMNGTMEIRHGTPDPRKLAEIAFSGGATSFEGGPISYTLPYSKNHSLKKAMANWVLVENLVSAYRENGMLIERETFGTLTGVLIPASLAIAINILEILFMLKHGSSIINVSFAQSGSRIQDSATAAVMRTWCNRLIPEIVGREFEHYLTLHMWMGPFPTDSTQAWETIKEGLAAAIEIGADRVVLKTPVEARRIPTAYDNIDVLRFCHTHARHLCYSEPLDHDALATEMALLHLEVFDIVSPIVRNMESFEANVIDAFNSGLLDLPYSPSRHVKGDILTARDDLGIVRYVEPGKMPIRPSIAKYHKKRIAKRVAKAPNLISAIQQDIFYRRSHNAQHSYGRTRLRLPFSGQLSAGDMPTSQRAQGR